MPASAITWLVEADTDGDGVYETNITGRISPVAGGFSIKRGLNDEGVYQVTELSLGIENADGEWTPENGGSGISGLMKPGIPVRVKATHNAVTNTLWTGYMLSFVNWWEAGPLAGVNVSCRDIADYLRRYGSVNVLSSTTRDTDGGITAILDAVGIAAGLRSLDDGLHAMPFHFVASQGAITAIMDCVYSEMGGLFWINKSGQLRFESRASRLGLTVDRTWGDGTNIFPERVQYESRVDDLISTMEVQATIFQSDQLEQEVLRFNRGSHNNPADSFALTAGQIFEADYHYAAPVLTLTTPVASQDYLANSAIDGSGTDKTSALTVTVTDKGGRATIRLVNTDAATIYVTAFRLRATVETFLNDRPIFVAAKSIPGQPSDQSATIQIPWADETGQVAQNYCVASLRTHRYPIPRLTLSFGLQRHDDIAASLLAAEIGDLVLYKDTGLGATKSAMVNDWWYIESLRYQVAAGEVTTCEVAMIPTYAYRDLDNIAYDLFTRANAVGDLGTALSGDVWADDAGFDIATNKARPNVATLQIPNLALGAANCVCEVSLSNMSADTDEEVGLIYRHADASNYWRVYVDDGTDEVILEKVVAGVVTELSSPAWTPTDTAELRVIAQGNRHRVWLDRKLVIDVTDAALNTNTRAGLFSRSTTVVDFDDYYGQGL